MIIADDLMKLLGGKELALLNKTAEAPGRVGGRLDSELHTEF
jgi:hypothetical protein